MPAKKSTPDFATTFAALREILATQADRMVVAHDAPGHYVLNSTKPHPMNGGPIMLGAVRTMKNYVSYHFMPVYGHPPLLQGISPALRKRMQGKACFNFTEPDPVLFRELAELTARGTAGFRKAGYA
jgi:hypothetical protein